jgi:hypothetical protein
MAIPVTFGMMDGSFWRPFEPKDVLNRDNGDTSTLAFASLVIASPRTAPIRSFQPQYEQKRRRVSLSPPL